MTLEEHLQALRELVRRDVEDEFAAIQKRADEAAADGDAERQQRHLAFLARLKAIPLPGERPRAA